ncbi:Acyl-[acyl-carrier-protein]--UDP-N-acetylglucosamine O-acyltransferase [Aliiroseovarius sp. xm-m-379]|uniref:acyl-ACP--UDP-N-acetylglucosamine O-acyltransferase n=1 Tax=unclassified Aliiroseovarius TaxID=2623558 RepID=UPI00156916F6|nr:MULTISPECIES: acyl-ACP--UDP-N-acetylglucosamine O-acyltransferase [unclassified Aliiroseovarius]NRP11960.1 Acyl-[acyl-carrier-protein]--UDP-N-acetylglucosamine O-acyltransferase [Aliiroseovarius sp. xm-d-517]NRP25183.1 Acyl-[acyl-carrier-protein]--UDP-N-acetylglucosamine O-acyltransferase [Aliiroseovarius sp. xm-m-379]NRP31085.1 Acyl-[acyl-carrier-protein]--UDP-N-acetylglucosamine O-acyltransferase [Aliiroseovarius sp. xm-m-314]NRP33982.1 Acyl-[acyl-carrier-protein]--UDP-N-acetylglucosamine 
MAIDPSAQVHASAIIEDGAVIGPDCQIGPFCHIGPQVKLAQGVVLKSHIVVTGDTEIGDETVVFPFSVIGEIPQDLKFSGEDTKLIIGKRNRIREHVTMNTGTAGGGFVTRVGDDGLFMAGCHVAHDAQIGNNVILVNNVAVAGHVVIEDDVIVGGLSGLHQWVRIGRGAIIGALSMVTADVLPHALVQGPRGELDGLNLVGLKRRGVARADITALRAAFLSLKQGEGSFQDRARRLDEETDSAFVREMTRFILGESDRGFLTPK